MSLSFPKGMCSGIIHVSTAKMMFNLFMCENLYFENCACLEGVSHSSWETPDHSPAHVSSSWDLPSPVPSRDSGLDTLRLDFAI